MDIYAHTYVYIHVHIYEYVHVQYIHPDTYIHTPQVSPSQSQGMFSVILHQGTFLWAVLIHFGLKQRWLDWTPNNIKGQDVTFQPPWSYFSVETSDWNPLKMKAQCMSPTLKSSRLHQMFPVKMHQSKSTLEDLSQGRWTVNQTA